MWNKPGYLYHSAFDMTIKGKTKINTTLSERSKIQYKTNR